jgi:hypothetical protein
MVVAAVGFGINAIGDVMRIAKVSVMLAVATILVGIGICRNAKAQAPAMPILSSSDIARIEQLVQQLPPGIVDRLYAEAMRLKDSDAHVRPTAGERQQLMQHKAEIEGLRTQVCSIVTAAC